MHAKKLFFGIVVGNVPTRWLGPEFCKTDAFLLAL